MIRAAAATRRLAATRSIAPLYYYNVSPTALAVRSTAPFSTTATTETSIIPQRNLWDTIYSGTKGIISLLMSEESRQQFMEVVNGSVINAEVLKQARFGNMLTLALFYDLQDPLFHKYKFDASDFLTGVQPALQNHHDTIGQLINEIPALESKEERTERLLLRMQQIVTRSMGSSRSSSINIENPWVEEAQKDPNSLAGQLSSRVSPNLLDIIYLQSDLGALTVDYKVSSTTISNVALLSARAMVMDDGDEEEVEVYDGEIYDGIEKDAAVEFSEEESKDTSTNTTNGVTEETGADTEKVASTENEIEKMSATKNEDEPKQASTLEISSEEQPKTFLEKKKEAEALAAAKLEAAEEKEPDKTVKMEASETESTTKEALAPEATNDKLEEAITKADSSTEKSSGRGGPSVVAQIEVLYELNQTNTFKEAVVAEVTEDGSEKAKAFFDSKSTPEMEVLVGTFEGWLNGGPDGCLRWRITHLRTPSEEFPGLTTRSF